MSGTAIVKGVQDHRYARPSALPPHPEPAVLIEPGLHLVASGAAGFDLGDPLDCNVWAFTGTAGTLLFDAGVGRDPAALVAAGRACGLAWPAPVHLILTHAHADHAGGAVGLRALLGAQVMAAAQTAAWVAAADEAKVSLPAARSAGVYPQDYRLRACPVDTVLRDGQRLEFGDLNVRVIATPGHSADHTAYLVERAGRRWLVSGDALFVGGKVIWQDTWDCSVPESGASLRQLAGFTFDALLPGHGLFALHRAQRHLDAALARMDALLAPASLA